MTIKRVLLPLVGGAGLEKFMEAAFAIGRVHGAEVRGLFVEPAPSPIPFSDGYVFADPETVQEIVDTYRAEQHRLRTEAEDLFRDVAGRHPSVEAAFAVVEGEVGATLAHGARLSDLVVLPGGAEQRSGAWSEVRNAALFQSGRPALFVPPDGIAPGVFDRVAIAWKESVEAARAVAAAQSFLQQAKEVHLIAVSESAESAVSLQDLEQYLQLHYSEVRSESVPHGIGEEVGQILLNKAEGYGALLVMGAYSHWRWREQVFGGVTRFVLDEARIPVLMAH